MLFPLLLRFPIILRCAFALGRKPNHNEEYTEMGAGVACYVQGMQVRQTGLFVCSSFSKDQKLNNGKDIGKNSMGSEISTVSY